MSTCQISRLCSLMPYIVDSRLRDLLSSMFLDRGEIRNPQDEENLRSRQDSYQQNIIALDYVIKKSAYQCKQLQLAIIRTTHLCLRFSNNIHPRHILSPLLLNNRRLQPSLNP